MPRGSAVNAEQKEKFLEYFRAGDIRPIAAQKVGATGSQFRALCNERAHHYDPEFAEKYAAIERSGEHVENRLEQLREAAFKRALSQMNPSDRILEKLLLLYDKDWEPLRTQRIDVNANLEAFLHEHFHTLNAEQMRQLIEWLQTGEEELPSGLKALPSAEEDREVA